VANPRQHVGNRVRHAQTDSTPSIPSTRRQLPTIPYQLALVTPGISPRSANSLKQTRHRSNRRMYARGLPHLRQRFTCLVENFGSLCALAIIDFLATKSPFPNQPASRCPKRHAQSREELQRFFVRLGGR